MTAVAGRPAEAVYVGYVFDDGAWHRVLRGQTHTFCQRTVNRPSVVYERPSERSCTYCLNYVVQVPLAVSPAT